MSAKKGASRRKAKPKEAQVSIARKRQRTVLEKENIELPSEIVEPVWEQQPDEPDHFFALFQIYKATVVAEGAGAMMETERALAKNGIKMARQQLIAISRVWFWERRAQRMMAEYAVDAFESFHRRAIANEESIKQAADSILLKVANMTVQLLGEVGKEDREAIKERIRDVIGDDPPLKFILASRALLGYGVGEGSGPGHGRMSDVPELPWTEIE